MRDIISLRGPIAFKYGFVIMGLLNPTKKFGRSATNLD